MAHEAETNTVQLALEQRIRELEDENARLSSELQSLSSDVARHKASEAKLADSERRQREIAGLLEIDQARLAAVLRNLPVAIWIADHNGRLIANNEEADRIWAGQSPLLSGIAEYPTYVARFQENGRQLQPEEYPIAMALQTGQPTEPVELKIRRFDGSEGTVLASAAPIKDREGQVTGAVGVNIDITERKQLEDALSESEFRFRTMADETPVLIWVSDATGRTEFVNKAYSDFFGVTLDQAQSGSWQILVYPEDQTSYVNEFMACLKQQRPFRAQARVRRQDGQWRWVISHGQPRFSDGGTFLGMAGSSLDITQQIETAEALRESEMKFRAAFEHAAIGYALQTPAGEFVEANAAYCNLVGYSLDELRQLKFFELLHAEDYGKHMQLVDQLLAREISDFVIESRYSRKDGKIVWVRKSCSLVTEANGEPKWMLALIEDISERKRIEKLAHESEVQIELQRRLMEQREQERLLIAQEIHDGPSQTLAGTLIQLELINTTLNDPKLQIQLNRIGSNIKGAVRELRDLIAEIRPPLLERFGLSQAIRAHAEEFHARYPHLELTHDIEEDQGRLSKEACLGLFRIYQEALNNIIRHANATKVSVRYAMAEQMAVLEIEDNGRGLEVIPDLTGGTAEGHYGLAGMKERAEAVNGEFQLRSTKDRGTTVAVKIPINKGEISTVA